MEAPSSCADAVFQEQSSSSFDEDKAFREFLGLYPAYKATIAIDALRQKEYQHLDEEGQVCLDYTGVGLFSGSQKSPELYGGFGIGLSPTSVNLATHAMYMDGGSTEGFFRRRILKYLKLNEDEYYIVFTANAFSAFKLLGQSYPFHEADSLLLAYDHECENMEALHQCACEKGVHVQSVNLLNPSMKIDRGDLQKKLEGKKTAPAQQKAGSQGLFAYPHMSRITGCKNSAQWIHEAQQNRWHVLLDVTSADAKFSSSLGLALFSPDFLIGSFYYVFGADPTGFGCLVIKRSVLRTLGDSSRARAIGMVKIVTRSTSSSSPDESSPDVSGHIIDAHAPEFGSRPGHRRTLSMRGFSFLSDPSFDGTGSESRATHSKHDDRGRFSASTSDETDNNGGSTASRRVLERSLDMDAEKGAEFCTLNQSMRSISVGESRSRSRSRSRSGKQNGIFDMVRLACDSEATLKSEAVMGSGVAMEEGVASDSRQPVSLKPPKSNARPRIPHASMDMHLACRGLDHADMLGNQGVASRLRALTSWLVTYLSRLRHPRPRNTALVQIFPRVPVGDQGSIIAFTVTDASGNRLHPKRVQMLADRSSISLRTGTIAGSWSSSEMQEMGGEQEDVGCVELPHCRWRPKGDTILNVHIPVVYISMGFLNNFSDVYKLWLFVSRFRDPGFVRQELWQYQALNQETIEI